MTDNATAVPDNRLLRRLVETVVRTADPDRVILFGSAARGEMTEESDLDILVVKDQCQPLELAGDIQVALPPELHPVDVLVVWPEDLEIYENTPWRPIASALRRGPNAVCQGHPNDVTPTTLTCGLAKPGTSWPLPRSTAIGIRR